MKGIGRDESETTSLVTGDLERWHPVRLLLVALQMKQASEIAEAQLISEGLVATMGALGNALLAVTTGDLGELAERSVNERR